MITREQALHLAQRIVDYTSTQQVTDAHEIAAFVLRDEQEREQLNDNLLTVQARCTELLEERRTLARIIEKIAAAGPDERDGFVAEALVAARGSQ